MIPATMYLLVTCDWPREEPVGTTFGIQHKSLKIIMYRMCYFSFKGFYLSWNRVLANASLQFLPSVGMLWSDIHEHKANLLI